MGLGVVFLAGSLITFYQIKNKPFKEVSVLSIIEADHLALQTEIAQLDNNVISVRSFLANLVPRIFGLGF